MVAAQNKMEKISKRVKEDNRNNKIFKALDLVSNLKPAGSLLIEGPAGIGKSSIVREWASLHGYEVLDIRLINYNVGDLLLKIPDEKENVLRNMYAEWLSKLRTNPKTIILLDEIDKASPEVQRLAYQLILDREVEGMKLPDEVIIVAIQNLEEEGNWSNIRKEKPLWDRFYIRIRLELDEEEFLKYAYKKLDKRIATFLEVNRDLIRVETEEELIVTPRRWEMLSKLIRNIDNINEIVEITEMVINREIALTFEAFLELTQKKYDIEEIIKNPEKLEEIENNDVMNLLSVISEKIATENRKEDALRVAEFLYEFSREKLIFFLKILSKINEEIIDYIIEENDKITEFVLQI